MSCLSVLIAVSLLSPGASFDDVEAGQYWELVPKTGDPFRVLITEVNDPLVHFTYSEPGNRASGHSNKDRIDWLKSRMLNKQTHLSQLERLEKQAKEAEDAQMVAAGNARVVLPDGSEHWEPEREVVLAKRARDMALKQRERHAAALEPPEIADEPVSDVPPTDAQMPGLMTLWGPDILLALAALAVIGILVKTLVIGRSA